MKKYKSPKWWLRFWKKQYRGAFSDWHKNKRSLRKSAVKALCEDFSDENIEKTMAMECFDKFHDIGYLE